MPQPSAAISLTATGPAAVNSWLPILNMPTRSAICFANFREDDSESKSRATIRLLRGWASKVSVIKVIPALGRDHEDLGGLAPLWQLHQFEPDLADARVNQANLSGH